MATEDMDCKHVMQKQLQGDILVRILKWVCDWPISLKFSTVSKCWNLSIQKWNTIKDDMMTFKSVYLQGMTRQQELNEEIFHANQVECFAKTGRRYWTGSGRPWKK
jgi:hypothetical protein